VSGAYVEGRRLIRSSPASYDAAREADLWARSEVLTGLAAPGAGAGAPSAARAA
jgi:hypothetical protein